MTDLRYAFRQLVRRPRVSAIVVLTLSLSVGASVAIFTVVDHALLRALPYPDSGRLITVWRTYPSWQGREVLDAYWDRIALSYPEFITLRETATSFTEVAIHRADEVTLTGEGPPQVALLGAASHTLPAVLGVGPRLGRWFTADEDRPGAAATVVLRHELWRDRFEGDPEVIGRTIRLDDAAYTVVGVLPRGFRFGRLDDRRPPDAWTAIGRGADEYDEGNHSFEGIARLRPGIDMEQALPEVVRILRTARLESRREQEIAAARPALLLLLASAGLLLLLACASVTTLLLTRVAERDREIVVRRALGAGRWRVVRQLLTESVVLSLIGGGLGTVVAWALSGALVRVLPVSFPGATAANVDLRILLAAVLISIATGALAGLVPALRLVRRAPGPDLRGGAGITRSRLTGVLVSVQVGLALVLLVGSTLLARSVVALNAVDPGFEVANRLSFRLELPESRYPPERAAEAFDLLAARFRALPGVVDVATTSDLPLAGDPTSNSIWIDSHGPEPDGPKPEAERRMVSPGYFRALGIPIARGRLFDALDNADALPVMLVSRAAEDALWGEADPIGDRVLLDDRWWTVVGVVEDVRDRGLGEDVVSTVYVPAAQWASSQRTFVVHTGSGGADLAAAVNGIVAEADPELPVRDIRSVRRVVAEATAPERRRASLVGGLSLLATVLALAGIVGVTGLSVVQRNREIGIRLALGSTRPGVFRLILGRSLRYAMFGTIAGALAAVALTRFISSQLYGVAPTDPWSFGGVAVALLVIAVAAAAAPAYRAARLDPAATLRDE